MGIRRTSFRWLLFASAIYLLTFALIFAQCVFRPFSVEQPRPADVIIVLAAGISSKGNLVPESKTRTQTGIALFQQGLAPKLLFTGRTVLGAKTSAAKEMAKISLENGISSSAILLENRARSTLQNAKYSLEKLPHNSRIILVTSEYHLLRSWTSFRLFGAQSIQLVGAPASTSSLLNRLWSDAKSSAKESLATWFNLVRYGIWCAAGMIGVTDNAREILLI